MINLRVASHTEGTLTRLHPPTEERREMRKQILNCLMAIQDGRKTASQLIDEVVRRGSEHDEGELTLELSRMLRSQIHMNANNSLRVDQSVFR